MATTNKRFVAKNGIDNNGNTITNVGASGNSLGLSGTGDLTVAISGTATLTVPATTDTLVTLASIQTLTNKTISGADNTLTNIGNGSLTNSSITINGTSVSLGGTRTLVTDDIAEDGSPVNLWFTDTRARNAFSAGTGVTITSGQVAIGQAVATTDNVSFAGVTADNIRVGVTGTNEIDTSSGNLTIDSTGGTTVMDDDVNVTGNMLIDGNLTVSGTTVTVNATNLAVEDNMIYLNNGSAVANPDLGFAGNYNDGTYRHAGIFRDASDGVWKFFHQYVPEPDASAYIDITDGTFALAPIQASAVTATTFTGALSGNASTATTLQTARNINGVSFNGSADITVTAAAGTLSGNTLASGVTASSLTSVGTLSSLTVSGDLTVDTNTFYVDATNNRVGIGTSSPDETLHINRAVAAGTNNFVLALQNPTTVADARVGILFLTNADTGNSVDGAAIQATNNGVDGRAHLTFGSVLNKSYSELVRIESDGNVGIGTTPNNNRLMVYGTHTAGRALLGIRNAVSGGPTLLGFFDSSDTRMGYINYVSGSYAEFVVEQDVPMVFNVNGEKLRILPGGNVGIGTSIPNISGGSAGSTYLTISTSTSGRNSVLELNGARSDNGGYTGYVRFFNNLAATPLADIQAIRGSSNTSGSLAFATSNVERIRIDASGNVGIGTTNPADKFQVNGGNIRVSANTTSGTFLDIVPSGTQADGIVLSTSFYGGGAYGPLRIYTGGAETMRITANNNVGIGTTNPGTRFDVWSSTNTRIRAKSTSATDSVSLILNAEGSGAGSTGDATVFFDCNSTYWVMGLDKSDSSKFKIAYDAYGDFRANTFFEMTQAGYITMANQPRFYAYGVGSSAGAHATEWIYASTRVNNGSHYNASNGRFTAPVAGTYVFFWGHISGTNNTVYRYYFRVNGASINDTHLRLDNSATGSEYSPNAAKMFMYTLAAGDYVTIYFYSDDGSAVYPNGVDTTNDYPYFSGYLIG